MTRTMTIGAAALSANERRVLGIYWQRSPLKK